MTVPFSGRSVEANKVFSNNPQRLGQALLIEVGKTKPDMEQIVNLISDGADMSVKNSEGENAVMIAAFNSHTEALRVMAHNNAPLDEKNNDGLTALMIAAGSGFLAASIVLCNYGADIDARDNKGRTASDIARANENDFVAKAIEAQRGQAPRPRVSFGAP